MKRLLADALDQSRTRTFALLARLDDDTLQRQPDPIMSPLVWDLGHIGVFEELWLLRALGDSSLADPDRDQMYNPFDNPRRTRGDLALLPRAEATTYLAEVREGVHRLLRRTELDPGEPLLASGYVYRMVEQHESQHQETMLQAMDLRRDWDDHSPDGQRRAYPPARERGGRAAARRRVDDTERVVVDGGPFHMGAPAPATLAAPAARAAAVRAYDNERPAHTVHVPSFAIDRFPVTARRYAAFIDAGGYREERWWSPRGREWLHEHDHRAPQGWERQADGSWRVRRFNLLEPLDPLEIVEHISFFEAEAFAAWSGGRLPTEAEWEKAAAHDPATGRSRPWPWGDSPPTPDRANLDRLLWGPSLVGSHPAGASAYGVEQLLGDGYEWTSSPFDAYPGYATFPYPEYSEVFFGGDYRVLRGASWATRPSVARTWYRNWDHPYRRQVFAGVRVAYDVAGLRGPNAPRRAGYNGRGLRGPNAPSGAG